MFVDAFLRDESAIVNTPPEHPPPRPEAPRRASKDVPAGAGVAMIVGWSILRGPLLPQRAPQDEVRAEGYVRCPAPISLAEAEAASLAIAGRSAISWTWENRRCRRSLTF